MQTAPNLENINEYYIPTKNEMGFMLTRVDPFVEKFVEYASSNTDLWHLDVGAAYGIASLAAIARGAKVIANDLDQLHLNCIINQCKTDSTMDRLKTIVGDVKGNINLPAESVGSILFSRVLHFFSGDEIIATLKKAKSWLVKGGKIFIISETPFFGTAREFVPEYHKRKDLNVEWPGYLTLEETKHYWESSKKKYVTSPVHLFDEQLIQKTAIESGLVVDEIGYVDRRGYFPDEALYDGRESIWAVMSAI